MKRCSKCGANKELTEFNKGRDSFGKHVWCRLCCSIQNTLYLEDPIAKERKSIYNVGYYTSTDVKMLRNARLSKRRVEDLNFKLAGNLRSRLYWFLGEIAKAGSSVEDLGCSIDYLKTHLENLFHSRPLTRETMSWENYGIRGWHVDHITPLAWFDLGNREQFLQACHYTNLQPLWSEQNLSKGSRDL